MSASKNNEVRGKLSVNRLFELFEQTSDAVFGIDKKGCVRFCNKACDTLLGYSYEEIKGRQCSSLLCGTDLMEREFCGAHCPVPKQHSEQAPMRDFDLIVKQSGGESVMVNISAYYPPESGLENKDDISVFFSLRRINCHRLIQRISSNSCDTDTVRQNSNKLSSRELGVLRLASGGTKTDNIAQQLCISTATVRNHFKNIYRKLDVHSRAEAIGQAMNHGLI